MRSRNIKPGFFKNEDLAELNPLTRILFIGLWCLADREGRFEWRPKRIKAEILPYDNGELTVNSRCFNGDVTVMLQELNDLSFIKRYIVDGIEYGEVVNFKKHQSPHHTEKRSDIPAPEENSYIKSSCCENSCEDNGELTVNSRKRHGEYPPDSLIPDSLIPDSKDICANGVCAVSSPPKKWTNGFDEFYKAYPVKKSKGQAVKTWIKLKKQGVIPDVKTLVSAIEAQKNEKAALSAARRFVPEWSYPSTWLNAHGWENDTSEHDNVEKYRAARRVLQKKGSECFRAHCAEVGITPEEVNEWIITL